jgi:N-acetylmuramoyl-L-alanine amidase
VKAVLQRRAMRLVLAACAVFSLAGVAAAALIKTDAPAGVLKVRLGGDAVQTRVVIELDGAASGRLVSAETPSRQIVIALPHTGAAGDMSGQGAGIVKTWSVDQAAGAARIKLDLTRNAKVARRFLLPPADGVAVYRYVIDVTSQGADDGVGKPQQAADIASAEPVVEAKKVVVIDAGHGGKDPGAHGASRLEKDVTLAAARALRDRLESTGRYKVVLTRDTDVFVPLETRPQIARRANADLFISLHADAAGGESSADTRGASVYTLSEHGVDRVQKGVFGRSDWFMNVDMPGQDAATKRILLDLTQRQTVNRSSTFAEVLLGHIGTATDLLHRSHRDAGLMVLLAPEVPAVLLEMGFITNPDDEQALGDPVHRRKVMSAVADAIDAYFASEARYALR